MPVIPEREITRAGPPRTAPFLKGPIPMAWLLRAGALPGRALHVSFLLWFHFGLRSNLRVRLSSEHLRSMGVDRYAEYRALRALEAAKLVTVQRRPGSRPWITILPEPGP